MKAIIPTILLSLFLVNCHTSKQTTTTNVAHQRLSDTLSRSINLNILDEESLRVIIQNFNHNETIPSTTHIITATRSANRTVNLDQSEQHTTEATDTTNSSTKITHPPSTIHHQPSSTAFIILISIIIILIIISSCVKSTK